MESVVRRIVDLAGPDEPPARLHGDLWSGNLIWGQESRVWLIDPAAHGGHRESDLAMLALFGCPQLPRVVDAYREVTPLADGWEDRVALHQLFPLLVHACMFGGGAGGATVRRAGRRRGPQPRLKRAPIPEWPTRPLVRMFGHIRTKPVEDFPQREHFSPGSGAVGCSPVTGPSLGVRHVQLPPRPHGARPTPFRRCSAAPDAA